MHVPLLLVQDSILKTKTPWSKLIWIGEDGRRVCSISQHLVGEVDLSSGSCSKVAKLTSLTRTAAAISATFDGVFVYGILSSGDLFFWHSVTNHVWQAKGIPEVVTHTRNPPESNIVREFFKQLLPHNFGNNITSDGTDQTTCSVPPHHKPKIFASSSCSKVVVVLGASQVYVWERSYGTRMEDCPLSQLIPGSWSVAGCPGDVSLPSTNSRETQISCSFMHEGNSEECHVTFTFVECSSVVASTLTLTWRGLNFHQPAAHWNSQLVSSSALGVQENELLHIKGTLISSYAHGQSLLAVAVNSRKQHSKLLYIHPLSSTAVASSVQDAVPHMRSSNRNTLMSQWVCDLAWSHDSLYLFGCLMSGALFIATRMGPLIKISCQGEGIQLQTANILGIQPHSVMATEEVNEEEGKESCQEPPSITFCISSHPNKHQVLLSSGLRVSVLSIPLEGRKEGEVVDCLLASATHALHLLCNSAVTHDYAYIRDSSWRLAHSVLDLTQGLGSTLSPNPSKISLWDRRVVAAASDKTGSQERSPGDNGELMQIEQVMKPLMAAWTLIISHSGPHTMEWRRRAGEVVVLVTRLVATLLHITTHDDRFEHQLQLLLVLHFYHQFVRVLCVWPNSFHMMKPTLQLTHRLLHIVLACERHAGERSMVSTLLILTQTLSSLEHSLTQAFSLRPTLHLQSSPKADTVQIITGVEVTNIIMLSSANDRKDQHETDNTISLRMKKVWQCLHENAKKVYSHFAENKFDQESYQKSLLVLNIVQSKLQNIGCGLCQRMVRLKKCNQLYLDGLYLKAIQAWKCEIITCLTKGHGKKIVAQDLHSILYAYFFHEGFLGISDFVNWLDSLLRNFLCPKKQSSLPNSVKKSATKTKSDEIRLSFEYSKKKESPKINRTHEAATKEENQETEVPVMRKLFHKEISSKNRVYTFSSVERTSSQGHIEVRTMSWLISAARQVMGSLGRILALETLGCYPDVPPPHKPHAIPPIWTSTTQPQGKVHQLPTMREGASVNGEWSVEAVAQTLAIGGCWGDLAVFTSWLDDAKMSLVAGVLASITNNKVTVPNTVLPLHQIKNLLCQPTNSTLAEFHSHQELLQLAAMTNLEILPDILAECLAKMKELTPFLDTFVPSQIHLPAPPVFCPLGPQDGEVSLNVAADGSQSERKLRQEVAGWLRLTCQVTSAAGIAYPVLLSLQQKYTKLALVDAEDLSHLMESLSCHQEHWHPQGPEWERITWLWHEVIILVWILYSRDKLSIGIRSLVRNAPSLRQNQEFQETCILEILSWIHELNTLCEHDSWRTDLVTCAVTAASEAPPVPAVAAALARIVPQPLVMPSLLRDKAERLFITWQGTGIAVSEVELSFKRKQNESENCSSPEIFTSLYSFYEDRCEEITQNMLSEEEKRESLSFVNKYPVKSSYGTKLTARIQEEFKKFLILFVELTFMRDVQKFPQHTSSVPLLAQFSDVLRRREFEGIKLQNRLHHDNIGSITNSLTQNILNSPCVNTVNTRITGATPEKKGLFRSLDYSKMLPRGNETIFISPAKRHVTNTPKNTPSINKVLHNFERENTKSKMSSSSRRKLPTYYLQGRRSRSLSKQKKRSASVPRPRSLSVSSGRGTIQQRSSKQHSELLGWRTSQTSSSVFKNLPIQKLLYLPQCLSCNTKQVEAGDTFKLLYWMMSQERQFCLPVVESDSYSSGRLARKVNFTLNDIMLSLSWNHLPKFWSNMENEKNHPDLPNRKLKKKKKEEGFHKKTQSIDATSHIEFVEVHQDTVISPVACPTEQLDINYINAPSKDKEYIPEKASGDEEKNKRLCAEPDAESMSSNSYLTERDQDREAENIENVQYNIEPASPLHLPCDLPDIELNCNSVVESDFISIQNHNKGSIINSSEDGEKQGIGGGCKISSAVTDTLCEDRDKHHQNDSPPSHITSTYKTFKDKRECFETSLTSSGVVKLEQNTNLDIRAGENNLMGTDQPDSRSEDPSNDVGRSFKINYKNQSKGHQVKVHTKEAKQSVTCKLPILSAPQRVSNMTGVEIPEQSSDPGIVPYGHILHLPSQTPSKNKMLRLGAVKDRKNAVASKPDQVITEDTLDNITLPDSLHASDLDEQSELSASSQNIQGNIIDINKSEPVSEKSEGGGTGLYIPLCVKKRVNHGDSCHWDHGDLHLKPVALRVKSDHKAIHRDEKITSRSERSMAHSKGNSTAMKNLKLLTLPKLTSPKKCGPKQEKPLLLKQLPIGSGYRYIANENQDGNQNAVVNAWLHAKERKVEHVRPLTIPKCFDSNPKDDRKTKSLNFLNPHQVFSFYRQSALKKHAEKFRSLKVTKKYIVPCVQPDTKSLVNIERKKEQERSDKVADNLDKGFLDQVKDYADKYKKGAYETILRSDKKVSEKEIMGHYKPIDDKKTDDTSTQNDLHVAKESKLVENIQSSVDIKDGFGTEKTLSRTLKDNLLRGKKELENKSVNTDPYEMRQTMKATGTQAPNMESVVFGSNTPSGLPSKSAIQTQTLSLQTVDVSVLTDTVKFSKNESVQVDSLLPQLPPPSFQEEQTSHQPQRAPLSPHPYTTPSHHSQVPSDTGSAQSFVHIFDIPREVVKEELKDIEMNRTIPSLDAENCDQYAVQKLFDLDEKRVIECSSPISNKDYKEERLYQKRAAAQFLDGTTKSDIRNSRLTSYASLYFDKDKESNIATSVSLAPSKIVMKCDNVTMDKLYEEFCSGRISLEDFYQMTTSIPEDKMREEPLHKVEKKESIQALEQQVLEAAQSISESQQLVEKVKHLIEEPETKEAEKYASDEKFLSNCCHRQQNSLVMSKISKGNFGWQEALSVYKNQGKSDALLRFLDTVDFVNITSDMIDEIIQCENSMQSNKAQKASFIEANDDSILLGQKIISNTTLSSNKMLPRIRSNKMSKPNDVDHHRFIQNEVDANTADLGPTLTADKMKLPSSRTASPEFHLSLGFIRSPESSHLSSVDSLPGKSTSTFDHEEKIQQRRKEIRMWIKTQRQKRREQGKSNLSLTLTKPQLKANKTTATLRSHSHIPNEAIRDDTPENLGLTGKQLQERNRDREVKRAKQRESHQKKREADISKLIDDYAEEATIYQSHVKPKLAYEFPSTLIKCRKLQNLKTSLNRDIQLGTKTYRNWHPKSIHGSASQKKPGLDRYFKNSTEEWRKRKQHHLICSSLSQDSSVEIGKHCVEETSLENSTSLQMELYYLKKCLDNKDKHKIGHGSIDRQETSLDKVFCHTLLGKEKSNPSYSKLMASKDSEASSCVTKKSSSCRSLPLNPTFTLPLDRISEVASNVSETSIEGQQKNEATLFVPTGDDTSTDSSWTVPEEVKNLLYNG